MNRARTAAVALFVLAVSVLWVRHQRARDERNRQLGHVLVAASAKETRRIEAIREAATKPLPDAPRPCPVKTRAKVVRLESMTSKGGGWRDVVAAIAEQRDPQPWASELDVVDGRAFLYDYTEERLVCVGSDADDPHGTLVAY